jgi:alcohol dehydrogenase
MFATTKSIEVESIFDRLDLQQVVFDSSLCAALPQTLQRLGRQHVLLVRDPIATDASGISRSLRDCLVNGRPCDVFDVTSTPAPAEIDLRGIECAKQGYDCIVAVGGGATMDAAKLIALRASNSRPLEQLLNGSFAPNRIPLIAAPTTAGSGSEATHFAVLFVDQKKYSIGHPSMRPSWAIVDPMLTRSVPQRVAVAAGLDALCQSIESLWSIRADSKSIAFASEALRLVVPNLHAAIVERNPQAQANLALGAHLAGQAINRSFTTVCHALSYALTSCHGIPHGLAAAATLPAALLLNAAHLASGRLQSHSHGPHFSLRSFNGDSGKISDDRLPHSDRSIDRCVEVLLQLFDCNDLPSVTARLVHLIRSVGGAASVSELQLSDDYQAQAHAQSVDPHRLQNNPRLLSHTDLDSLILSRFDSEGRVVA